MNTKYEEHEIADVFADQANGLGFDDAPFDAIVDRGRARRRRRVVLRSAAAAVAFSGVAYGSFLLLRPAPDELAVTAGSPAPSNELGSTTSTLGTSSAPGPVSTTGPADRSVSSDALARRIVEDQDLGRGTPVAYRDGFLLSFAEVLNDDPTTRPVRVSFIFTSDGESLQSIGELDIEGDWGRPFVDGDTLALAAVTAGQDPELRLYRSEDLTTWKADVIDLSTIGPIAELTPAMRDLLDVGLALEMGAGTSGGVVTNGDRWVVGLGVTMVPNVSLRRAFDLDDATSVDLTRDGLIVTNADVVSTISPEELGVSVADLESYERANRSDGSLTLSGRLGQSAVSISGDQAIAGRPVLRFGDGFAVLDRDGRIQISDDGQAWAPLPSQMLDGSEIVGLTELDADLLALAIPREGADGDRVSSYRVATDGATTFLSEVPLEPGQVLDPIVDWNPAPGVFVAIPDVDQPSPVGDVVLYTENYEITLVNDDGGADSEESPVHYEVRRRDSGEIVAENTRDFGDWQSGEPVDGVLTVIFTDSEGRPDVGIPLSQVEDAIDQFYTALDSSNPNSSDGGTQSTQQSDHAEIATGDGVHWFQNPDPDRSRIGAVNGSRVLITRPQEDEQWFEVVDLDGAAAQS